MSIVRGSGAPVRVTVRGVNLALPTVQNVSIVFGRKGGTSGRVVKSAALADLTVNYDAETNASRLTTVILGPETALWRDEVAYTIYVEDESPESPWVPTNGGNGVIPIDDSVPLPP